MTKMNLDDLNKMKEEYEKALREKGQEILAGAITEFFKAAPEIGAVGWSQYTPHFNDGDECVFSVNDPCFHEGKPSTVEIGEFRGYESYDDAEGGWYGAYGAPDGKEKLFKAAQAAWKKTLGQAPDDLFRAAFGDHVQVVVTADGKIRVEDHDHD